jgi:hypothetical protein
LRRSRSYSRKPRAASRARAAKLDALGPEGQEREIQRIHELLARDATCVLDDETELPILEHTTDKAGYTDARAPPTADILLTRQSDVDRLRARSEAEVVT